jgi:hypothetical protein
MDLSTLNYKQIRDVAVNQDFQSKLAIAIADAAITVYTEAGTVAGHTARAAYATQVIKNPDNEAKQMAWAVVLIANDDADATLKATVLGIWNAFAGVA